MKRLGSILMAAVVATGFGVLAPRSASADATNVVRKVVIDTAPRIKAFGPIRGDVVQSAVGYAYSLNATSAGAVAVGELTFGMEATGKLNVGQTSIRLFDKSGNRVAEAHSTNARRPVSATLVLDESSPGSVTDEDASREAILWTLDPQQFATGKLVIEIAGIMAHMTPFAEFNTSTMGPRGTAAGMLRTDVPDEVAGHFSQVAVRGIGHIVITYDFRIEEFNIPLETYYPQTGFPGAGDPPPPLEPAEAIWGQGKFTHPVMAGDLVVEARSTALETDLHRFLDIREGAGHAIYFASKAALAAGTVTVEQIPTSGVVVQFGRGSTWNQIVAGLNAWSTEVSGLSIPPGTAIAHLTVASDGDIIPTFLFGRLTLVRGTTPDGTIAEVLQVSGAEPIL